MKKSSKLNPSSVPVQHSHTTDTAREAAVQAANDACRFDPALEQITPPAASAPVSKPEPKPDTRLPIDPEQRKANRILTTAQVINHLADQLPDVYRIATTVGQWVWVQFPAAPAPETRQQLSQLGFHWNAHRQAWQHPCGKFSISARASDPRDTYASKPAMEAFA